MHWHSFNNAVCLLNKAKSQLLRSTMNFKNFENHVDFVCRPASQPASQPTSQPAIRPSYARCRALKITQNNRLLHRIYETVVPKTIFLLRHGDSFVLPYITFFGMCKQLASPQHSIHGVNREVNAPAVL